MEAQVAVFGILRFPPENIKKLLPYLKEFIAATYENDKCIKYKVAEDILEPGLLRFSELWQNKESLEKHLKASHIEPWRAKSKEYGLIEREFTAYKITDSGPV